MVFNPGSDLDTSRVRRGGSGGGAGVAVGGVGGIALLLLGLLFGLPVDQLLGGGASPAPAAEDGSLAEECRSGADANASRDCRVVGTLNSLDSLWSELAPQHGVRWEPPGGYLFGAGQQSVSTGCGTATTAVGPFYCPADATIYLETAFFDTLEERFGSAGGPLAEEYVVAHEYGHHMQNLTGQIRSVDQRATGPSSDSVRLELQADCYAGIWVSYATRTVDASGQPYLTEISGQDIDDALSAAAAVGDDRIQQAATGQVQPHTWTHGSAEQRMRWFLTGYETGDMAACDTFSVREP
jgi:uncharacterized protein